MVGNEFDLRAVKTEPASAEMAATSVFCMKRDVVSREVPAKKTVAAIKERLPDHVEARDVFESFHNMLRRKSRYNLKAWLDRAARSLVASFAHVLSLPHPARTTGSENHNRNRYFRHKPQVLRRQCQPKPTERATLHPA